MNQILKNHRMTVAWLVPAALLMVAANLFAQDEPRTSDKDGCKDYENISRYKGAIIQNCYTTDHDKYVLGLGAPAEKSFRGHGKYFTKYLDLEGKIIRIQYLIDKTEGIDKVSENYKAALSAANYKILCSVKDQNWPFFNEDFYGGDNPINNIRKFGFYIPSGSKGYSYISASGINQAQNDVYVSLFITYGSNYGKEFILVTEEIVIVNPVETGLVTAQSIENMLDINGHIPIYGIYFETGKFDILPESDAQMKAIADFLNAHKDNKYLIVGHTDNVGNFAANQELSEKRAEAVSNALVTKYGVDANQIKSFGVANLAPVSSNNTDNGKARNRRVEIVQQ